MPPRRRHFACSPPLRSSSRRPSSPSASSMTACPGWSGSSSARSRPSSWSPSPCTSRCAARTHATPAPRSSSSPPALGPRGRRGGGDGTVGAAPRRGLPRACRRALGIRERGTAVVRRAPRGARSPRARALRAPRGDAGGGRTARRGASPRLGSGSGTGAARARRPVSALEQRQEQRIAEVEARLDTGGGRARDDAPTISARQPSGCARSSSTRRQGRARRGAGRAPVAGGRTAAARWRNHRSPAAARAGASRSRSAEPRAERRPVQVAFAELDGARSSTSTAPSHARSTA